MNKQEILNRQWQCTDEVELLQTQREVLPAPTHQPKRALRPTRPIQEPLRPTAPPTPETASVEFFRQTQIALAYEVNVVAHHGRVWVVQYQPRFHYDPIVPIVRGQKNGRYLRALRRFCYASIDYEQSIGRTEARCSYWWMTWKGKRLIASSKRLALAVEEKKFFEHHVLKFLAVGM